MTVDDLLNSDNDEMLTMDGYDDCIAGVVEQFGRPPIVCYDKSKVLAKLQQDGMSEEDAEEWFYFNQIGAYLGDYTPCFITLKDQPATELARILLMHAVDGIFKGCGNSYSNTYTQHWLSLAKSLGAYHGKTTGKIRDLEEDWSAWLDANDGLPDLPPNKDQHSQEP